MKECIVVLGMHRSGTSVLSGLISIQGFHLGASQMPLREDNPKGFFENHAIYRFNQDILEACGTSWDNYSFTIDQINDDDLKKYRQKAKQIIKKEFGVANKIFIKDPRMCLLFPLWAPVLRALNFNIKIVLAFRSPMEVALSLQARNEFITEKSLLIWSHYCFQAEINSRPYERMIVKYADDFKDFPAILEKLSEFLCSNLNEEIFNAAYDLYTPELTHHRVGLENISDDVPSYLRNFITLLKDGKLTQTSEIDNIVKEFYLSQELFLFDYSALRERLKILEDDNTLLKSSNAEIIKNLDVLHQKNKELERSTKLKIDQLEKSENQTKLALEEAEKKAKLALEEAEKQAKLVLEESEKKAKLALEETEKQAKLALEESEKQARLILDAKRKEGDSLRKQLKQTKELLRVSELNNTKKNAKLKSSYNHLAIGNQLFEAALTDSQWKKKFSRLLINNHYFRRKLKRSFFASKARKKFLHDKVLIVESGLFSPFYYLTRYPKAWENQVDPLNFFNKHGWKEGQNPGPHFNTKFYLEQHPDVSASGENPLLHYIKKGRFEGLLPMPRDPKEENNINKQSETTKTIQKNIIQSVSITDKSSKRGGINEIIGSIISVSFPPKNKHSLPVVTVNGFPATKIADNIYSLSDKKQIVKHFKVSNSINDKLAVELFEVTEKGVALIDKKVFTQDIYLQDKFADIKNAAQIAALPGAVAITVWEGAHNPIGRAKVLYDIVESTRPVVIFAYVFGSFGAELWSPLINSGINVVLIPYNERYIYHQCIQQEGIKFDTVWICKHRLHSFELASFISHEITACILDMDDNEDVFVSSKGSELKPYGIFSKNKGKYFLDRVKIRSVASISIQKMYGGEIVRHVRKPCLSSMAKQPTEGYKTAVFVGTIRPHKNIEDLVLAITKYNSSHETKVKLAIGGDFNPPSLRQSLASDDVIILGSIVNENLYDTLALYDVVITGFPDKKAESNEINRLQITSKIGDGLAVGKPVLTPDSPSVSDLKDISGLFVFDKQSFNNKLEMALAYSSKIVLPDEFTIPKAYKTFEALEAAAKQKSLAGEIFELEPFYQLTNGYIKKTNDSGNLVLIWKQHDSGIYGRRIDQIARYYKHKHPNSKVTVIEAIDEISLRNFESPEIQYDNFSVIQNDILGRKIYRYTLDDVEYHLITYNDNSSITNSFEKKLSSLLNEEGLNPSNTVMILFPLIPVLEKIIPIIKDFKIIVDLVDNQVQWAKTSKTRIKVLKQYYETIAIADRVVANSPVNIDYFKQLQFLRNREPALIPNWYTLPHDNTFKRKVIEGEVNLIYSGNLNDRIDWKLMDKICKKLTNYHGYLHIVGTTVRSGKEMKKLLTNANCIYHGVNHEEQLLKLLQHIDFAVVPHAEDHISKFMDPIKLKMYKKLGIKSLCSQLPGLRQDDPMLILTESRADFLLRLEEMLEDPSSYLDVPSHNNVGSDKIGDKYISIIEQILET